MNRDFDVVPPTVDSFVAAFAFGLLTLFVALW
jgi:hypothetical protein